MPVAQAGLAAEAHCPPQDRNGADAHDVSTRMPSTTRDRTKDHIETPTLPPTELATCAEFVVL